MASKDSAPQRSVQELHWDRLLRPKRRSIQFNLRSLMLALIVFQVVLVAIIWCSPKILDVLRVDIQTSWGSNLIVTGAYFGIIGIGGCIPLVLKHCKPETAYIAFIVMFSIAICLTVGTFYLWEDHPSILGYGSETVQSGLSFRQSIELAAVQVAPGVWIFVLFAGLGVKFSFMEHPD